MSPIRLVTFDVTNTIIRVLGNVGQNYAKIAKLYDTHIDADKLDTEFKKAFMLHSKKSPNFGVHDGLTPAQWWSNVVTESFHHCGSDVSNIEQISRHLYIYFSTKQGWEVIDRHKTEQTLTQLKQLGIKIGIISNFDERLEKIMNELALRHYFDFVLSSTVAGVSKPDARIFKMALELSGVMANEALHIGDNVENDYHGATKAGLKALLLWKKGNEPPKSVEKKHVIANIDEVLKYTC